MYIVYGISKEGNVIDGANWSSKEMAYQLYFEYNYFGGIAFIIDTNYPSAYEIGMKAKRNRIIEKYLEARNVNNIEEADKVLKTMCKLRDKQVKELNPFLKNLIGRTIDTRKLIPNIQKVPQFIMGYYSIQGDKLTLYKVIESNEYVRASLNDSKPRNYKIYYHGSQGRCYFNFRGIKCYLDEMIPAERKM